MFRFQEGRVIIVDRLGILPYLVYPIANLYYFMFRFLKGRTFIMNFVGIVPYLSVLLPDYILLCLGFLKVERTLWTS